MFLSQMNLWNAWKLCMAEKETPISNESLLKDHPSEMVQFQML